MANGENAFAGEHQCFCAFLDILGFREEIAGGILKNKERLAYLEIAYENAMRYIKASTPYGWGKGFFVRTFTDNTIIAAPVTQHISQYDVADLFLNTVCNYQYELARQGLFIRGGISVGPMHLSDGLVVGEPLIDAYDMEQNAVYPRVCLSTAVETAISQFTESDGLRYSNAGLPLLLKDSDGLVFCNYLGAGLDWFTQREDPEDIRFIELERIRNSISKKIDEFRDKPKIRMKYAWAANYLNKHLEKHGAHYTKLVEPILF